MKLNFKTTALLALAGLALTSQVAKATVAYADGDLLLGFRDSSGTSTSALLVDIGQAGYYRDLTSNVFSLSSVGNLNADLTTAFGSGWATNTNIQWGLVGRVSSNLGITYGSTTDALNTLYASKGEATFGTTGTGFARAASGTQGTPGAKITTMANNFNNDLIGWTAGVNPNAIIEPTSGNSQNWASYNPGTSSFSYFNGLQGSFAGDQNSNVGLANSALDLFRMAPGSGTGTYEGTFTLTSTGNVNFGSAGPAVAAVPEPGRAVLLALGAASLVLRRRRARNA